MLDTGLDNWKQHYAAWLLSYITSVRPGSITVSPGYERGAELGAAHLRREDDETLRWQDVTFFRMEGVEGISVRISFGYLKNSRDLHRQCQQDGQKKPTFLPTRGAKYELDLSAILLGLAFSRGLSPIRHAGRGCG